jgi:hypothetical protein
VFNHDSDINSSPEMPTKKKEETSPETTPLLYVDVNLGGDNSERIVVFDGDTAIGLAKQFCELHNLDEDTQEKLEELLES